MSTTIRIDEFPLNEETEKIIGIGIQIHKTLGFGFLEIVYKDAFNYEFFRNEIPYFREKKYIVEYKKIFLPHFFYAD